MELLVKNKKIRRVLTSGNVEKYLMTPCVFDLTMHFSRFSHIHHFLSIRPDLTKNTIYSRHFAPKMWASAEIVMMNTKGLPLQSSSP